MKHQFPPEPAGHDPHELSCEEYHHRHPIDRAAPDCDDQLPMISTIGRGPQGYGYKVEISDPDTCTETYLEGFLYDPVTGEYTSEWKSENINGGELSYQYNLRPHTIPRTFTVTFIYRRPGRCEWSWTTPAIPYIWTLDPAGEPDEDPDHVVGSGIATLMVKTVHEGDWNYEPTPDGFDKETGRSHHERLWYPMGPDGIRTTRDQFNAPKATEGWSATLVFGRGNGDMGGTIDVPDFDDLANFLGVSKKDILYKILDEGTAVWPDNIEASDYTDWVLKHMHKDLGFEGSGAEGYHDWDGTFGGQNNVKDYIDWAIKYAIQNMSTGGGGSLSGLLPKPVRYVNFDDTKGNQKGVSENCATSDSGGSTNVLLKFVVIRSEIGLALAKVNVVNPNNVGVTFRTNYNMSGLKCFDSNAPKDPTFPAGTHPAWQVAGSRGDGTDTVAALTGTISGSCPDGSVSGTAEIPWSSNPDRNKDFADLTVNGNRSESGSSGTLSVSGHLGPGSEINVTVPYFFGNY